MFAHPCSLVLFAKDMISWLNKDKTLLRDGFGQSHQKKNKIFFIDFSLKNTF